MPQWLPGYGILWSFERTLSSKIVTWHTKVILNVRSKKSSKHFIKRDNLSLKFAILGYAVFFHEWHFSNNLRWHFLFILRSCYDIFYIIRFCIRNFFHYVYWNISNSEYQSGLLKIISDNEKIIGPNYWIKIWIR